MVYCTYNMLNTFRALLCPSSGARDCMCVITAYGVRCLGCWLFEVRCRATCCPVPDLQQPATKASHTIGGNNTHCSRKDQIFVLSVNCFYLHVPPVVASCCVISGAYMSQGVGIWRNSRKTARTLLTTCQYLSGSNWITPLF